MSGEIFNPVFHGSLSLIAGNLLGSTVDTLVRSLNERANLTSSLDITESTKKILDNSISILFHVSFLGLGTHCISNSFPLITEVNASFTLLLMGIQ